MNKQQGRMLTALETTRHFLGDHAAVLGTLISPSVRQKLDDAIANLEVADLPELAKLTLSVRRLSFQQLGAHADGMAECVRPYAQVGVRAVGRAS